MENRRRITEEDLQVTEALIAQSYGRLKKSVLEAPARALGPISQTISEHPLEAAATAVGGGIAAYGIARMITPRTSQEEGGKKHGKKKKNRRRSDPMMDILSAIIPLTIPYLTGYLGRYMGIPHDRDSDKRSTLDS
ncbi:MAG: hypothetical protein Q8R70_09415 [Methanoregula sp.]|nr:hypothetical protein [Methanoregula sp.]